MKHISVFIILLLSLPVVAQKDILLPVCQHGLYGYIDKTGVVKIPLVYDFALDFKKSNFAIVAKRGRYGVINRIGDVVIPLKEDKIEALSDSVFAIEKKGKWALVNAKNEHLTAYGMDGCSVFDNKLLKFRLGNRYGLISYAGKLIVPPFYSSFFLNDELILVKGYENYGLWTIKGEKLLDTIYDEINIKNRWLVFIENAGKMGYYSLKNKKLIAPQWKDLHIVNSDTENSLNYAGHYFIIAQSDSLLGLYSWVSDSLIMNPKYAAFSGVGITGFIAYSENDKVGLINANGVHLTEPLYDKIYYLGGDCFAIKKNKRIGMVDSLGNQKVYPKYDEITYLQDNSNGNGLFSYTLHSKKGLLSVDSVELTKPLYDELSTLNGKILAFKIGIQFGIIDENGFELIKPIFTKVCAFQLPIHYVYNNSLVGLLSSDGKLLAKPIYAKVSNIDNTFKLYRNTSLDIVTISDNSKLIDSVHYDNVPSVKVNIRNEPVVIPSSFVPFMFLQSDFKFYFSQQENKWGLRDENNSNKITIKPMFNKVKTFPDSRYGLVFVDSDTSFYEIDGCRFYTLSRCGLVDMKLGLMILEPNFINISMSDFIISHDNLARVVNANGEMGYVTGRGDVYCRSFGFVDRLHDGAARINMGGELAISEIEDETSLVSLNDFIRGFSCKLKCADNRTKKTFLSGKAFVKCMDGNWGYLYYNERALLYFNNFNWIGDAARNGAIVDRNGRRGFMSAVNRVVTLENMDYVRYLTSKQGDDYYVVQRKQLQYGFLNADGVPLTDLVYDDAYAFSDGMAAVCLKNKWGFINEEGELAIDTIYERVGSFSEGLAPIKHGRKWGFIDKNGNIVIQPRYNRCGNFVEGKAWVRKGGSNYYINPNGEAIGSASFLKCTDYKNGFAIAYGRKGIGVINDVGEWLVEPKYSRVRVLPSSDNLLLVSKGRKQGVVSADNEKITALKYSAVKDPSEGLIAVRRLARWGFLDEKGNAVISCKYEKANSFANNRAAVMVDRKWGVVNKSGKMVIPAIYNAISDFSEGLAMAQTDRFAVIIDTNGNIRVDSLNATIVAVFKEGKALVKDKSRNYYYIDSKGKKLLGMNFYDGEPFNRGCAKVKTGSGWGIIDSIGKVIATPLFGKINDFRNGIALVSVNSTKGVCDIYGNVFVDPKYHSVEMVDNDIIRVERNGKVGYVKLSGECIWELSK